MIERTIGSDPPPGPFHRCPKRINCEFTSLTTRNWPRLVSFEDRPQYFRCCLADGYCPLTGLSCDRGPTASQVDPAPVQGAELARPEPGDQEQFESHPDVSGTGRHDSFSLSQRYGRATSDARLPTAGDWVDFNVALAFAPTHAKLHDGESRVGRGLPPPPPGHPLAEVVGLEPGDFECAADPHERPDPAAVGLHGRSLESPLTVSEPEFGEVPHDDPAGRVGASPHGEPGELSVGLALRSAEQDLPAVERGVPRTGGLPEPGSGDTSAGHGEVLL